MARSLILFLIYTKTISFKEVESKMKILLVTMSLTQGGITQFTINIANYLAQNHDVTLAYTCVKNETAFGCLNKCIKCIKYKEACNKVTLRYMLKRGWIGDVIKLKLRNRLKISPIKSVQRVSYARAKMTKIPNELSEPFDIAISTAEFFCNDLVSMKIIADKKIAWIHPDYKKMDPDVLFDRKVLDSFDFISVVSKSNREQMIEMMPDAKERIVYIPNLMSFDEIKRRAEKRPLEYRGENKLKIVTVCRLDNSSKRLDRVIAICRKLKEKRMDFKWYIVGSGGDEKKVSQWIKKNKIDDCLILLGGKENPYPYIKYADLFVLTSQYEGRPIAVDEALLLKCPVIVTNYTAAKEQVSEDCGSIVPNKDEDCIDAVVQLIQSDSICKWKQSIQKFDIENMILSEFERNICRII